jgi:glycosyltransferase involved in cell wall biosynthesis
MGAAKKPVADVCMILEGTYPYIAGGVSTWTHDLIRGSKETTFHLVSLLPKDEPRTMRYELPPNITGITHIFIQDLRKGPRFMMGVERLTRALEPVLLRVHRRGALAEVKAMLDMLAPYQSKVGRRQLLDSPAAWQQLVRMYQKTQRGNSFIHYFWTWRALVGGLYSVLLSEMPLCKVYHAVSTGYAGLLGARAALQTGRPLLLTEHGIYTNERRVEIAMADWLFEVGSGGLAVETGEKGLKDLWVDSFLTYSRACYEAATGIITLFEGNQRLQIADGADRSKMWVIPNGVDVERFTKIKRGPGPRPPTVALIGRVVPIKDVKTFIRAADILKRSVPDVKCLMIGPYEEDPTYYEECKQMVEGLGLTGTFEFTGRKKLDEVLGQIDVNVLTSISEGQPLVVLEAGAAGVPSVATNVGSCSELIYGREDESPRLGPGGEVTGLSNPRATAAAIRRLITDQDWHDKCAHAIRERCKVYYDQRSVEQAYGDLYTQLGEVPDQPPEIPEAPAEAEAV